MKIVNERCITVPCLALIAYTFKMFCIGIILNNKECLDARHTSAVIQCREQTLHIWTRSTWIGCHQTASRLNRVRENLRDLPKRSWLEQGSSDFILYFVMYWTRGWTDDQVYIDLSSVKIQCIGYRIIRVRQCYQLTSVSLVLMNRLSWGKHVLQWQT